MMHYLGLIKKALNNKIILYVITRYITYAIQFVVSLLCAAKMGPYYFGLWGVMLLMLNYMQQINFGIASSANVLLVQERNNTKLFGQIESTSILAQSFLCIGVLLFAGGNIIWGYSFLEKYPIGNLFYIVCLTAMIAYMVQMCMTIYRIKHSLVEIAISQSVIPVLALIALFLETGKGLLFWFALAYFGGNLLSLMVFILRGKISLQEKPKLNVMRSLLGKGFYLFVYNSCFYLIIISTRTVVSSFYEVEEFGFFSFAYTLADAVLLLMSAITFLLFPKLIEKFHTKDMDKVKKVIGLFRTNYMTLTHGIMYLAFIIFPVIPLLFPKYSQSLPAIYMISLALLANTFSCGYSDFLMAQNKERRLACISFTSLVVNVILALILAIVFHWPYQYVALATIISYVVFSLLCIYSGSRIIDKDSKVKDILKAVFPTRLLIPFLSSSIIMFIDSLWLVPIPLVLFTILNTASLTEIARTTKELLGNPDILDVSGV